MHTPMATIYSSSNGFFQYENGPRHKAKAVLNWLHEHDNWFSVLQWPSQSPNLSPVQYLWDVVEEVIHSLEEKSPGIA